MSYHPKVRLLFYFILPNVHNALISIFLQNYLSSLLMIIIALLPGTERLKLNHVKFKKESAFHCGTF